MATVVSITNPITGAVEQVDKLDHTAQQIDDAVALAPQISNPNLLDNWYFANPVNQRGQTSYIGAGYGIDRWKLPGAHKMELADNGLKITCNASATVNHCLAQVVEGLRTGLTYTLSALIVENTTADGVNLRVGNDPGPAITGTGLFSWTFVASGATDLLNSPGMQFNSRASDGDNYFVVLAMKLELGSQQTLAHQDVDGNWVLNEIPDYGEQLRRCQRYCKIYGSIPPSFGQPFFQNGFWREDAGYLMVSMVCPEFRATPVVSVLNGDWQLFDGKNVYTFGQINIVSYIPGIITLGITSPGNSFSSGKILALFANSGRLMLSADL